MGGLGLTFEHRQRAFFAIRGSYAPHAEDATNGSCIAYHNGTVDRSRSERTTFYILHPACQPPQPLVLVGPSRRDVAGNRIERLIELFAIAR